MTKTMDGLCVNTIRTLAMDAVQRANSGHPGTPMALAPVVYCLWQRFLRFDPSHPIWPNRDRFVLSAGHASMLLYAMLHLTAVRAVNPKYETLGELSVTLEDIKRFRQLDSKCPGHPEYRWTSGVETTTGPLGQGVATSVGMAIAERWLASYFNRPGFDLFNYDVYALCGDGCLMEGISGEAASLAGHLKLANLCLSLAYPRSCNVFRVRANMTARRYARAGAVLTGALLLASGSLRAEETSEWAFTGYVGRITTVNAWHNIFTHPNELEFADAYLATLALSHPLRRYLDDDLGLETEGQVVYNFGDQSHWEFNALLAARWYRFPWNDSVATTLAFGGGLSWASEVPEVEVELEGSSEQLLIYWHLEMTFAQPGARWAATLRLHHRSGGFGLLADDGGMNALCLGARVQF